ncbi:uncharacterized protein LOC144382356 isoform X1 [Halichoerus grypus]
MQSKFLLLLFQVDHLGLMINFWAPNVFQLFLLTILKELLYRQSAENFPRTINNGEAVWRHLFRPQPEVRGQTGHRAEADWTSEALAWSQELWEACEHWPAVVRTSKRKRSRCVKRFALQNVKVGYVESQNQNESPLEKLGLSNVQDIKVY